MESIRDAWRAGRQPAATQATKMTRPPLTHVTTSKTPTEQHGQLACQAGGAERPDGDVESPTRPAGDSAELE